MADLESGRQVQVYKLKKEKSSSESSEDVAEAVASNEEEGDQQLVVYTLSSRKKTKSGKKKRSSKKGLRFLEKAARRTANAGSAFFDRYLEEHNASNEKKKDGWIDRLDKNVYKAVKAANRELKVDSIVIKL